MEFLLLMLRCAIVAQNDSRVHYCALTELLIGNSRSILRKGHFRTEGDCDVARLGFGEEVVGVAGCPPDNGLGEHFHTLSH